MNMCIGDLFQCGHSFDSLMNMSYFDYIFLIKAIGDSRAKKSSQSNSGKLRPVQRDAIKKAKELEKK